VQQHPRAAGDRAAAVSPQRWLYGAKRPREGSSQAWLQVTSRTAVATSRRSSHGGAREASGLWEKEQETIAGPCAGLAAGRGTPALHPRQRSPQHGSRAVSEGEGAVTGQWVPGGRRGGRAASQGRGCLPPAFLPPASAWSPAGDVQQG